MRRDIRERDGQKKTKEKEEEEKQEEEEEDKEGQRGVMTDEDFGVANEKRRYLGRIVPYPFLHLPCPFLLLSLSRFYLFHPLRLHRTPRRHVLVHH